MSKNKFEQPQEKPTIGQVFKDMKRDFDILCKQAEEFLEKVKN